MQVSLVTKVPTPMTNGSHAELPWKLEVLSAVWVAEDSLNDLFDRAKEEQDCFQGRTERLLDEGRETWLDTDRDMSSEESGYTVSRGSGNIHTPINEEDSVDKKDRRVIFMLFADNYERRREYIQVAKRFSASLLRICV